MDLILSSQQLDLALANRVYLYSLGEDGSWLPCGPGVRELTETYIARGFLVLDKPING